MANRHLLKTSTTAIETDNKGFLLDANVWLFLYGDVDFNRNHQTGVYSNFLKIAKATGLKLYSSPVIVSEFHNRMIKSPFLRVNEERKAAGKEKLKWKDFRGLPEAKEAFESAADNVSFILDDCALVDLASGIDWLCQSVDQLVDTRGELNDCYIEKICLENNLALVTDDYDFAHCDITIFSANRRFIV